jgi:HSP20 family protein
MASVPQIWSSHFRDLDHFRRDFDDLFNRMLGGQTQQHPGGGGALTVPPIETFVEDNNLVIRADLPGIDPKDVEVSLTGNDLVIRGSRENRTEEKDRGYIHREVTYGRFERQITLPDGVKSDQIKAAYRNGVLELRIPLPEKASSRKVPIQVESNGENKGENKPK